KNGLLSAFRTTGHKLKTQNRFFPCKLKLYLSNYKETSIFDIRRRRMPYNIRIVSTYPPRRCGIATFSRNLANALSHFTGEVGHIRVAAIDNGNGPYNIPVDLVIDQYNPKSWKGTTDDIITRAQEGTNPTVVLLQHE